MQRKTKSTRYGKSKCWLPSKYILVITEKPKAGRKIAEYLSENNARPLRCSYNNVPFWIVKAHKKYYVVGSAAGHLYGLTTDEKGFPVFSYYWAPLWKIDQGAKYTRKFLNALAFLAKNAEMYINACDYDIEGSVIGYLIIKNLGDERRALRAKFSALTRHDIQRAFRDLRPLDYEMIEAGLARHELDWLWGINVSRALMDAVKLATGKRITLSAGRVQSPTLKEAVNRTIKRNLFVPLPYFNIYVTLDLRGKRKRILVKTIQTKHEAEIIATNIRKKPIAKVIATISRKNTLEPPPPFNLGDLQAEASRIYRYDPHYTQEVAEQLYLEGLISYPRTNSQKIPPTIDVKSILKQLASLRQYREIVNEILIASRGLPRPRNGKKDDPAHPAIHPTSIPSSPLPKPMERIYDLIVRRFLASMLRPAIIVNLSSILRVADIYEIKISGGYIAESGWLDAYPYLKPKLEEIPLLEKGAALKVLRVEVRTELTRPPELHTKISLVKWMESVRIGTEATRARIVKLLFDRKYLVERSRKVYATDLGIVVAEVLERYFPLLVSVELTRQFEEKLESIRNGKLTRENVIKEAKTFLTQILTKYKQQSIKSAGIDLAKALGIIKPAKRCIICGRESVSNTLCKYHSNALTEILNSYNEWRKRLGTITFDQYIRKIATTKRSGIWVRDVANAIIEGKLHIDNTK
ncbi:DNA topoisomerase I [Pyrofollis japonicus]|uniref:DNA topoisomerase I n=1 Tax=Pyrofollis japonicus TaxID=3060460 RepID=UPI00295C2248|nr:DNA topoisomerase I [Pyrofollis japonicus]BEP17015.1 DNA topoisomerase I [Pyrofollis japonicus]